MKHLRPAMLVAGGAIIALAGCAHRTRIETNPMGANVFVKDQFVCVSPCVYQTPATQLESNTPVRVERPGFETVRAVLETYISVGRIVGGIFTVGLVPLFKWPHTYVGLQRYNLRPLTTAEKLAAVDRQHQAGKITDAERERARVLILTGAGANY